MTKIEPRQSCMFRRAAQAAEEAWQQTIGRASWAQHHKPDNVSSASQDEDSDDMDFSAPPTQCTAALWRLMHTLLSKGAWQQVTRIEDLCRTHVLPQVALSLGRLCGKYPDAARLHHQRAEKTWKQGVDRIWRVPTVWLLLGPTAGTRRTLQHRRSHTKHLRMRSRRVMWIETRRPRCHPRNPEGSQATQSRPADICTTAAVPDGCVCGLTQCSSGSRRRSAGGV